MPDPSLSGFISLALLPPSTLSASSGLVSSSPLTDKTPPTDSVLVSSSVLTLDSPPSSDTLASSFTLTTDSEGGSVEAPLSLDAWTIGSVEADFVDSSFLTSFPAPFSPCFNFTRSSLVIWSPELEKSVVVSSFLLVSPGIETVVSSISQAKTNLSSRSQAKHLKRQGSQIDCFFPCFLGLSHIKDLSGGNRY